jgi:gamma-glutamyl:cysteine ligase YbdK (ATP-grasp superfamily)
MGELVAEALRRARPHAAALGFGDELGEVQRIMSEGNGADRQRAAFAVGGLDSVCRALIRETREGGPVADEPVAA